VQLIGNGTVYNHEGIETAVLKHPSHTTVHKNPVSSADEAAAITRFYRWHTDAALYDLSPPKVTTLYVLQVPQGGKQICRYDDGTGDTLPVPLGTTAFVSGKTMFDILPRELQSALCAPSVRMDEACRCAVRTARDSRSRARGRKSLWTSYLRGQKIISKCCPWYVLSSPPFYPFVDC
jgi:hypothetical protein